MIIANEKAFLEAMSEATKQKADKPQNGPDHVRNINQAFINHLLGKRE
jgi:hypothetical protein